MAKKKSAMKAALSPGMVRKSITITDQLDQCVKITCSDKSGTLIEEFGPFVERVLREHDGVKAALKKIGLKEFRERPTVGRPKKDDSTAE